MAKIAKKDIKKRGRPSVKEMAPIKPKKEKKTYKKRKTTLLTDKKPLNNSVVLFFVKDAKFISFAIGEVLDDLKSDSQITLKNAYFVYSLAEKSSNHDLLVNNLFAIKNYKDDETTDKFFRTDKFPQLIIRNLSDNKSTIFYLDSSYLSKIDKHIPVFISEEEKELIKKREIEETEISNEVESEPFYTVE